MSKYKLLHGDCLEKMKDIPDGSVDMVLTDIPYGVVNRASNGLRNLDKGCADVVDRCFIENQKTVVRGIERNDLYSRILFIVFFKVEAELLCNAFAIDFRRYAFLSF